MSRGLRAAFIAGPVVAAAAIAFLVVRPGGDDAEPASAPATQAETATVDAGTARAGDTESQQTGSEPTVEAETTETEAATTAQAAPGPEPVSIRVVDGQPAGGPAEIEVRKDDVVRFTVTSDVDDEIHVHGYDISKSVGPGRRASFRFDAGIEGIFEVELEGRAVEIATLVVRPR